MEAGGPGPEVGPCHPFSLNQPSNYAFEGVPGQSPVPARKGRKATEQLEESGEGHFWYQASVLLLGFLASCPILGSSDIFF